MERNVKRKITARAINLIKEFERMCADCGQPIPQMPPIPIEAIANLVYRLSVKGVRGLSINGKEIAGFLDPIARLIAFEKGVIIGRQRFSIAHEIGHYVVHYLPILKMAHQLKLFPSAEAGPRLYFRCTPEDMELSCKDLLNIGKTSLIEQLREEKRRIRQEVEANTFAAELLMPTDLVRQLAKEHRRDVNILKEKFNVSHRAMDIRLVELGLKRCFEENIWKDPQLLLL
jgi:hypothetical protein